MTLMLATATRSALADALNGLITTGSKIEIRDGTRPTGGPDAASTGTVLLATVALGSTAFNELNGVLTIVDPAPVTGAATGTATWFRLLAGTTAILDGSVSNNAGTGDLKLATTSITSGLTVDISSGGTITIPAGTAT